MIDKNLIEKKVVSQNEKVEIECKYEGGEPLTSKWVGPSGVGTIAPLHGDESGSEDIIVKSFNFFQQCI